MKALSLFNSTLPSLEYALRGFYPALYYSLRSIPLISAIPTTPSLRFNHSTLALPGPPQLLQKA